MKDTVSPDNKESHMPTNFLIVLGPSGVGKGAIIQTAHKSLPNLKVVVSHTTRAPRPGEVDGVHYHFTTRDVFEEMIREGAFIEWAMYPPNKPTAQYYGTSWEAFRKTTGIPILEIEIQGALAMRERFPQAKIVLIEPPTIEILEERIANRNDDTNDVAGRLEQARIELQKGAEIANWRITNETGPDGLKRAVEEFLKIFT